MKLPTDEEIWSKSIEGRATPETSWSSEKEDGFDEGAKWMRSEVEKGVKELGDKLQIKAKECELLRKAYTQELIDWSTEAQKAEKLEQENQKLREALEKVIEEIKAKADSIPTTNQEYRRLKGAYVDCLMIAREALKQKE